GRPMTTLRDCRQNRILLAAWRRKRAAADCTAAQAVAAAPWQTEWAIPSWRADQGRHCGAAEIQGIAENASPWPAINASRGDMRDRPSKCRERSRRSLINR